MRFEAGLTGNTVKAARIESKASAGEAAWAVMRGWSYPTYMAPQLYTADVPAPLHAKERLRPPPVEGSTLRLNSYWRVYSKRTRVHCDTGRRWG